LGLLYGDGHPANNNAASTTIAAAKTNGAKSAAGTVRVTVLFRIMFSAPFTPAGLPFRWALCALCSANGGTVF
jgi:hypothetical protein